MLNEPDFVELGRCRTVRGGRVVNRCKRWTVAIAVLAGAWLAYWLANYQLPYVAIHADESGRWDWIDLDWSRTMMGRSRN